MTATGRWQIWIAAALSATATSAYINLLLHDLRQAGEHLPVIIPTIFVLGLIAATACRACP